MANGDEDYKQATDVAWRPLHTLTFGIGACRLICHKPSKERARIIRLGATIDRSTLPFTPMIDAQTGKYTSQVG
ncbi:MAG: hypothetical protein OXF97_02125 [Nitrospira sp.]|nr:hypothetical protein [Nitrospira sp.]MCY4131877.1 hypothetical protein [Nitrospira sp.]